MPTRRRTTHSAHKRSNNRAYAQPAVRILYSLSAGKDETIREIVAFRRGERVYFFKAFYAASDGKSRKEVRAAVDSVVW